MIRNNIKLAIRHLKRNKFYTAINVTGLAIGITACLVICLLVQFELSYDKFRQDRDLIYRVHTRFAGTFSGTNRGIATPVADWMSENVLGIAHLCHFFTASAMVNPVNSAGVLMEPTRQPDVVITGPSYFNIFPDYNWLSGDPLTALAHPNNVVITDSKARQYFGVVNPIDAVGRNLVYMDSMEVTVSGIVEAPPVTTDLRFHDFISYATIEQDRWQNNYNLDEIGSTNSNSQLFVKLGTHQSPEDIERQLVSLEERYAEDFGEYGFIAHYRLQPFTDLHFNGELGIFDGSERSPVHLPTLYILLGIAVMILLIAAINFINLETAQSIHRAQEVGVRKVFGADKKALVRQFLTQTFLVTTIGMLAALLLSRLAFWYFADFIPPDLTLNLTQPLPLVFLIGITIVVALLAGIYPAFVLSAFSPALALKDRIGSLGAGGGSVNLRRGLVVFQFFIAQVLIFGTLVVGRQVQFMINKDMGFKKDAIIYFSTPWKDKDKKFVLATELRNWPEVVHLSQHASIPASNGYTSSIMKFEREGEQLTHDVYQKFGDTSYVHLYGLEILAGRNITQSDTVKEFLINETYSRQLGFQTPLEAVGNVIEFSSKLVPIVGVVADFHTRSLHEVIQPVAIANRLPDFSTIGIQLAVRGKDSHQFESILSRLEDKYKSFYPDDAFNSHFLDETVAHFYESEMRTVKLMNAATFIAILISCLGLLGLVSFAANQRTKEIGIRKVLGASVSNIVELLSREFLLLVGLAFLLAAPLAWWAGDQWLNAFAYRIQLSWWLFALCALAALILAMLTMSVQAIRAARNNPADSLRSE